MGFSHHAKIEKKVNSKKIYGWKDGWTGYIHRILLVMAVGPILLPRYMLNVNVFNVTLEKQLIIY